MVQTQQGLLLSVVAPCYNEEESLRQFCQRVSDACRAQVGSSFEIVLVDDGSRDRTWPIIEDLSATNPNILGVRLFRNHGHQLAATAGLSVTRGERVMPIDADLQDPPELLPEMMSLMDQGADVVYCQRVSREGEGWFKLLTASLFYRLIEKISPTPIPRDTGDFRLMNRRVVDALNMMPEHHRFLRGMVSWIGGKQVALPYERQSRFAGTTKYPLRKMIRFATDAITSFSIVPLRLAAWLGVCVSAVAFLTLFYVLFQWLTGAKVPGWASELASNSLFAGTQLLVLGIIGEYLGRAVEELKGRPLFMIGKINAQGQVFDLPIEFSRLRPEQEKAVLNQIVPVSSPNAHGRNLRMRS